MKHPLLTMMDLAAEYLGHPSRRLNYAWLDAQMPDEESLLAFEAWVKLHHPREHREIMTFGAHLASNLEGN